MGVETFVCEEARAAVLERAGDVVAVHLGVRFRVARVGECAGAGECVVEGTGECVAGG